MSTIYCIGEALIDFLPTVKGTRLEDVETFSRAPGGGPANISVACAKLGAKSAFIGKVGDDAFGRLIIETLRDCGVDTTYTTQTAEANTTLAFVTRKADGDKDFVFCRKPGADMLLSEDDIPDDLFKKGDILQFDSLSLVESPSKYAHKKAIRLARNAGAVISFDPNVRLDLWADHDECKRTILEFLPLADILKMSLDEMPFIFDSEDEREVAKRCLGLGLKAVVITRGADGSAFFTPDFESEIETLDVQVEDTTGAGDAYIGAMLSKIAGKKLEDMLNPDSIRELMRFSNAVGAITTTKKGGITAIPTLSQIEDFFASSTL